MVSAIHRCDILAPQPEPFVKLREADTLMLYGKPEKPERAEKRILDRG
jgi:K+/H+ antiporter YhaU regulatory subunit KhtT